MEGQRFYESIYYLVKMTPDYWPNAPFYLQFVFPYVFTITILVTAIITALYYNIIGNLTSRLGYHVWWFVAIRNPVITRFISQNLNNSNNE